VNAQPRFHCHEAGEQKQADMDKLVRLFHHPLPRVLFWLTIILIFEALDLPWRWRKLRARLS
jgi:hypothetical protein